MRRVLKSLCKKVLMGFAERNEKGLPELYRQAFSFCYLLYAFLHGIRSSCCIRTLHVVKTFDHEGLPNVIHELSIQIPIEHCEQNSIDEECDSDEFK